MHQIALVFKLDQVETTEGRRVLILPATSNTETQPFCLESQFGNFIGIPAVLSQFVEGRNNGGGGGG